MALAGKGAAQHGGRLTGQADRAHPIGAADLDDQPCDRRMQVHVLVRVDMVEREAGRPERLELGADLGGKQAPHPRREEIAQAGADLVVGETPVRADQATDLVRRQHRAAVDQHKMQPDAQARQPLRPRHRVGRGGRADHQARAGQDAITAGRLNRLVDRDVAAEIVSRDDQPSCRRCVTQWVSLRAKRSNLARSVPLIEIASSLRSSQ